jgi:hypothetical protein
VNRTGHENTCFFYGREVEHTPAYQQTTLFVVGIQPIQDIEEAIADPGLIGNPITHIFFGANHSFDPQTRDEWVTWENMIQHFLDQDYLCSLDIPVTAVDEFNEGGLCEYTNFVPQIRVSIPYTKLWNYNTMLKIDDRDFAATNPGVWCHRLHTLMNPESFTDWREYKKDQVR